MMMIDDAIELTSNRETQGARCVTHHDEDAHAGSTYLHEYVRQTLEDTDVTGDQCGQGDSRVQMAS